MSIGEPQLQLANFKRLLFKVLQLCALLLLFLAIYQAQGQLNDKGFCICCEAQPGDVVPDPIDCSRYYLCGADFIDRIGCPAGQVFDSDVRACVPGTCDTTPPWTPTPTPPWTPTPGDCENGDVRCQFHGQIIPHADHCRLFWTCVELCPELGFCELGKWFDRDSFVCDYPCNVLNCPPGRD